MGDPKGVDRRKELPAMSRSKPSATGRHCQSAFTLVELLVVLGIISLLVAFSVSAILTARRQAYTVICGVNLGNMAKALITYANNHHGAFPVNFNMALFDWHEENIIGPYAGYTFHPAVGGYGPALICPEDEGAIRSYSMNMWASSAVIPSMRNLSPVYGTFWKYNDRPAAQLLLAVEAYSTGNAGGPGWNYAPAYVGQRGLPAGQRFGALGGVTPFRVIPDIYVNSQLQWRHRRGKEPCINLAFADGHVKSFVQNELVYLDGTLTGEAYWCPTDRP